MKMNYLSKRDAANLVKRLRRFSWGSLIGVEKPKKALKIEGEGFTLYKLENLLLCEKNEVIFPTVHEEYNAEILRDLPTIIVDMGAVPHIVNGADVMRPGVREFRGKFKQGEILVVRDERNLKSLAITIALKDLDECISLKKGKIAENLHHANDKIWKFVQENRRLIKGS